MRRQLFASLLCVFSSLSAASAQDKIAHDKEFWKQIARNDYRVPAGESAASLIDELTQNLGSPDPELRDDLAYDISAAWIYKDGLLSGDELRSLIQKCENNLLSGIGEMGTDSVLLRSFSALELSLIAAFDNKKPFMSDADFEQLLTSALNYMNAERDLRGYDREKGWMHATAHTADLLKFLGRNSHLRAADQSRILDTISTKLRQSGQTFVFGENGRMAMAVMSLIRRSDFEQQAFASWLARFVAQGNALWKSRQLNVAEFASVQNANDLLRGLLVQLDLSEQPDAMTQAARRSVLDSLKQLR
ncbi:MAG TPA: DUF2785 domain-containing protein [Terriglobales bacterium]|nr:DUF2785 domain-containing protein [Terriglobales bacterium]